MSRPLDTAQFSARFTVRPLTAADAEAAAALAAGNPLFYHYHPPAPTPESLRADMAALPPGKRAEDKYFAGYFDGGALIALLDMIADYPQPGTAHIGFFMLAAARQSCGLGSRLVQELLDALRAAGFRRVRLGTDIGNPQSAAFWTKNGFCPVGETERYIIRGRPL